MPSAAELAPRRLVTQDVWGAELGSQAPECPRKGVRPPLSTLDIRHDKAVSSRTFGKRPQVVFIEAFEFEVEGIAEQSAEESLPPFLPQANGVMGIPVAFAAAIVSRGVLMLALS